MTAAAETSERPAIRLRPVHVIAVAAGNGLEFFDFLIYATFAIFIGKAYFPTHDPRISLLLSLATFGVGFVPRPIGGIVIGLIGDRVGRRPAMLLSFGLMGVGALGLAATPTYAQIGIAAPILVILARLVQGFALGGEVGPSTAFLVEAAGDRRRGLIGSFQSASQGIAMLAASGVAMLLAYLLPQTDLAAWGWRLGFFAGLTIVPFGLLVRRSLPETAPPRLVSAPLPPDKTPWAIVALGVMMLASGTINTYVASYMTTFAMDTMHLSAKAAFGVGVVNGVCALVCLPIGGWLSDRFGRKVVAIPSVILSTALLLPALSFALAHPSAWALDAAAAVVAIPGALGSAAILVAITESFPPSMRCLAVGLVYAGAITVFGGSAQFVVQWLVLATHQPMAPAYYRFAASLVGLAALVLLPESAPVRRAATPTSAPVLASA
ncbi:MAG TPA: MFS transporter [Caulobacteraceae bacterium]|nr:MFS transporter [Caulobacteraceae bacterium]